MLIRESLDNQNITILLCWAPGSNVGGLTTNDGWNWYKFLDNNLFKFEYYIALY